MAASVVLEENEVNTLKCSICDNYLSVPPILIISADGPEQICGRCKDIPKFKLTRNTTFEELAKFAIFPCIYEYCSAKIAWGEAEEHELICPYRTMRCPMYWAGCKVTVRMTELHHHIRQKHKSNFFTEKAVVPLKYGTSSVVLLQKNNMPFLVSLSSKISTKLLYISVYSLKEPLNHNLKYKVKIAAKKNKDCYVCYSNQRVKPYIDKEHCKQCLEGHCELKNHQYSMAYGKGIDMFKHMTSQISAKHVIALVNSEMFTYTVSILDNKEMPAEDIETSQNIPTKSTEETTQDANTTDPADSPEETSQGTNGNADSVESMISDAGYNLLRQYLMCPVCSEYMVPPIFSCNIGHVICNRCTNKLEDCPTCKAPIEHTRNFSLEAIAEVIEIECRHANDGCKFVGTTKMLNEHEPICLVSFVLE